MHKKILAIIGVVVVIMFIMQQQNTEKKELNFGECDFDGVGMCTLASSVSCDDVKSLILAVKPSNDFNTYLKVNNLHYTVDNLNNGCYDVDLFFSSDYSQVTFQQLNANVGCVLFNSCPAQTSCTLDVGNILSCTIEEPTCTTGADVNMDSLITWSELDAYISNWALSIPVCQQTLTWSMLDAQISIWALQ
jgi:hypothetical protein